MDVSAVISDCSGRMVGMKTSASVHRDELLSEADADRLAELMQALASPVRLRILSALRGGAITVTELTARLALGQTTVSNHLRVLRHLSLVAGDRRGRHIYYALFDKHVVELLDEAVGHIEHLPTPADGPLARSIAPALANGHPDS